MLLPNRAGRDEDEDEDGDGPRASSQRRGIHAHTSLHAKEPKQVQAGSNTYILYIHAESGGRYRTAADEDN